MDRELKQTLEHYYFLKQILEEKGVAKAHHTRFVEETRRIRKLLRSTKTNGQNNYRKYWQDEGYCEFFEIQADSKEEAQEICANRYEDHSPEYLNYSPTGLWYSNFAIVAHKSGNTYLCYLRWRIDV